jgi:quercetin dioxygenase-like cupin family protein
MPFFKISELPIERGKNSNSERQGVVGELMKASIITKQEGVGPPLHFQPNEEQFTFILKGNLHVILDDEERICGPGDLFHIPRNCKHRSRAVNGSCHYFTIKSPAHTGDFDEDYNKAPNAEAAERGYPGK